MQRDWPAIRWRRFQRVAKVLSDEGYELFRVAGNPPFKRRRNGEQYQVFSCDRAEVFARASSTKEPVEAVIVLACMTHCGCHQELTLARVDDLMYEPEAAQVPQSGA